MFVIFRHANSPKCEYYYGSTCMYLWMCMCDRARVLWVRVCVTGLLICRYEKFRATVMTRCRGSAKRSTYDSLLLSDCSLIVFRSKRARDDEWNVSINNNNNNNMSTFSETNCTTGLLRYIVTITKIQNVRYSIRIYGKLDVN